MKWIFHRLQLTNIELVKKKWSFIHEISSDDEPRILSSITVGLYSTEKHPINRTAPSWECRGKCHDFWSSIDLSVTSQPFQSKLSVIPRWSAQHGGMITSLSLRRPLYHIIVKQKNYCNSIVIHGIKQWMSFTYWGIKRVK